MTSREKFEQAIKARFGDSIDYRVCKNSDGEYMAWDMQVAWWAWQTAETELAVQLANAESKCRELAAANGRVVAERDALRENIGGDITRSAADIYFQLVEECEIPPGGSLVGYIDNIKDRLSNAENHHSELDNVLCELLPGTQYMDPPDGGSVTPLEQVRRMVADYRGRIEELESRAVRLPKLPVLGSNSEWYEGFATGASSMRNECADAIRAAGIGVKGE